MFKRLLQSEAYRLAHEFNATDFGLALPIVITITASEKFAAQFFATWENDSVELDNEEWREYHHIKIAFSEHWKDFNVLRCSVYHELVHCFQHEQGLECNHDASFWAWEKLAIIKGLTIRFPDDNFMVFIE